jgi:hypothetical protein
MDSRVPFLDWLRMAAATAACDCERVSASQHDADHPGPPTDSATQSDDRTPSKHVRRVRLIPCTPALHAVGE